MACAWNFYARAKSSSESGVEPWSRTNIDDSCVFYARACSRTTNIRSATDLGSAIAGVTAPDIVGIACGYIATSSPGANVCSTNFDVFGSEHCADDTVWRARNISANANSWKSSWVPFGNAGNGANGARRARRPWRARRAPGRTTRCILRSTTKWST